MTTETDPLVPDSADPEDLAILDALDALALGEFASAGRPDESAVGVADETLRRLYVEVLGLLPSSLDPVAPKDRVLEGLMAKLDLPVSLAQITPIIPATTAAPAVAAASVIASPVAVPVASVVAPQPPVVAAPNYARAAARRSSRWPLALAAVLAFALAGLSLFLLRNLEEQTEQVASLYVKLAAAEQKVADLHKTKGHLAEMEKKYSLVTNPGGSIDRLAPAGDPQAQPDARGLLFVAADHQHWVLCLEGLEPAATGKGYQLWFVSEGATVSGGTFSSRPGEMVELSAESMPEGTRAVLVTLEPAAGSPLPSGPQVLATAG